MVIPSLFTPEREVLTNYDWIDMASATGFIVFDGFNAIDSTGDNYTLAPTESARAVTGDSPSGVGMQVLYSQFDVAAGQDCDLDFDLSPFQLPRTIEGTGFVRVPLQVGAVDVASLYVIARLRKFSAGETTIVSVQSPTDTTANANQNYTWTLELAIPRTHFKQGDILRLTIEIYSNDTDRLFLGHNPNDVVTGGEFSAGGSRLSLTVPFKLDFM